MTSLATRRAFLALACVLLTATTASTETAPDPAALATEAKGIIKGFSERLLAELQDGLKRGGPPLAVHTCNVVAPGLADEAGAKSSGWKVGRTALRIRNPKNAPDAWETATLQEFASKITAGADPMMVERAEIVADSSGKRFRFMKAIPVGEPCLQCHGSEVKAEVKEAIAAKYPADKATGFSKGELRGAFTLSKTLP